MYIGEWFDIAPVLILKKAKKYLHASLCVTFIIHSLKVQSKRVYSEKLYQKKYGFSKLNPSDIQWSPDFWPCSLASTGGAGATIDWRHKLPDRMWEEAGEGAGHQDPRPHRSVQEVKLSSAGNPGVEQVLQLLVAKTLVL